jgi:hypothetical protein
MIRDASIGRADQKDGMEATVERKTNVQKALHRPPDVLSIALD